MAGWFEVSEASRRIISSILRRFFACNISLAFSIAEESRFLVRGQVRIWCVYVCGAENVCPHMQA